MFDLNSFAGGALAEQLNEEIDKVLANIDDPNTDEKKPRKIVLTLNFKPDKNRDMSDVNFQIKATLVPSKAIETRIFIDKDLKTGQIRAAEMKKGQIAGQVELEEIQEQEEEVQINNNIVDLRASNK